MRVIRRMLLVCLLLPGPVVLAGWARAAPDGAKPAPGGKTVKECNEELGRNAAALEAAGESASAFFHRCWFHTEKGKPTPVLAKGEGVKGEGAAPAAAQPGAKRPESKASEAKASEPEASEFKASGPATAAEGTADRGARTRRHAARRREARRPVRGAATARRRERDDDEASGVDDAPVPSAAAVQPGPDRLPGHVNVGVPIVGVVAVPILPGLEPAVRTVVEHPVVPGLVTTSP